MPSKYAVFDTEGTGLFDYSKPAHVEGQPRLCSIAVRLIDGENVTAREFLVKPDGWVNEGEALAVNGLTMERLNAEGVPVAEVLDFYTQIILDGYILVAYNAQHDTKVMRAEFRRLERDDLFTRTPNICLMHGTARYWADQGEVYKTQKLGIMLQKFGIEHNDAHTAGGDADGAMALFVKLRELGALPEAKVHFAKNRPVDDGTPATPKPARKRAAKPAKVQADDQIPE